MLQYKKESLNGPDGEPSRPEELDITPSLNLLDILRSLRGVILVRQPSWSLLRRLNLLRSDPEKKILLLFEKRGQAVKTKKMLARARVGHVRVLCADMPLFTPLRRRSAGAIITPVPFIEENERLRFLRKAAGMLEKSGVLLLHARVRGHVSGIGEHMARVLFMDGHGLPDEFDLVASALRSGFNRIEKHKLGRLQRKTFILARKNSL